MRGEPQNSTDCHLSWPATPNENEREGETAHQISATVTGSSGSRITSSLPPRGLNRVTAAAYLGISPCLFDQMVKDGRMPVPLRIITRVIWDRRLIDGAFDSLLKEEAPTLNPWDEAREPE